LIILDASALYPLAKLSLSDPTLVAEKMLEEEVTVLDLTLYEAANAVIVGARRGLVSEPGRLIRAISEISKLLPVIRIDPSDLKGISELAEQMGLTVYEAAYVHFARVKGGRLITSDGELLRKAGDVAIELKEWLKRV